MAADPAAELARTVLNGFSRMFTGIPADCAGAVFISACMGTFPFAQITDTISKVFMETF